MESTKPRSRRGTDVLRIQIKIWSLIVIFGFFSPLNTQSLWDNKSSSDTAYQNFRNNPSLRSEAYEGQYSFRRGNELEWEDFQYAKENCPQTETLSMVNILQSLSFYDAYSFVKLCPIGKERIQNWDKSIRQKIFQLLLFPNLEWPKGLELPNTLRQEIQNEWETFVYTSSLFYKPHQLVLFGREREITNSLQRILITKMSESSRILELQKVLQDLREENKSSFVHFFYTKQNPWNVQSLEEENKKAKIEFQNIVNYWILDQVLMGLYGNSIQEVKSCLEGFPPQSKKQIRLIGFYGFFSEYGIPYRADLDKTKLFFLRKFLLYESHHFPKRIQSVLEFCKKSVLWEQE